MRSLRRISLDRIVSVTARILITAMAIAAPSASFAGNKAPLLNAVSPGLTTAGTPGITLNISGANFNGRTVLLWNGSSRQTTVLTSSSAQALVSSADLAAPGTAQLKMKNTSTGQTSTTISFTVAPASTTTIAPVQIATTTLPSGQAGTTYSATLAASGGTAPYSWYVGSGSLPSGISLSTSGVLSGTPSAAGTSTVTLGVQDSTGSSATSNLSISITAAALMITTATLPSGVEGSPYNAAVSVSGGTPPYTWSMPAGSLPSSVALAATTGSISGTPTSAGTYTPTIQVTDAAYKTVSQAYSLAVSTASSGNSTTPNISNVVASVTPTTATITWTTDSASDTLVSYDPGTDGWAYDEGMTDCGVASPDSRTGPACLGTGSKTGTMSHSFTLTGLHPSTTYYFGVRSRGFTAGVPDGQKATFAYHDANYNSYTFTTTAAPTSGTMDYWVRVYGGQHVTQGKSVYGAVRTDYLQGTSTSTPITVSFSGLPSGATLSFPGATAFCTVAGSITATSFKQLSPSCYDEDFQLTVPASTAPGTYNMTITFTADSGTPAPKFITWPITVDSATPLPHSTPASYPPIPCLNSSSKQMDGTSSCSWNWTTNMITYGSCWGVPGQQCPGSGGSNTGPGNEQGGWYYDGERVDFQIHDYDVAHNLTSNPAQWNTYAANWESLYAAYVSGGNGTIYGNQVFPQGLYMGWLRNGTAANKTDIDLLATNSYRASLGATNIDSDLSREVAYLTESMRYSVELGYTQLSSVWVMTPSTSTLANQEAKAIDFALGHVDQWVVSQTAHNVQPFMLGLTAEALIKCYEDAGCSNYQDVRIPWAVKNMADWLWANAWNQTNGAASWPNAFFYNNRFYKYGLTGSDQRYVNQLSCPMYGWLFQYTGDPKYQSEGDQCWQAGVNVDPGGGVGWSGKNFNQNYRWSFDYVTWRSAPI
jgi:putative Ig domain-containing protein/purple acid phosphatase-like protein